MASLVGDRLCSWHIKRGELPRSKSQKLDRVVKERPGTRPSQVGTCTRYDVTWDLRRVIVRAGLGCCWWVLVGGRRRDRVTRKRLARRERRPAAAAAALLGQALTLGLLLGPLALLQARGSDVPLACGRGAALLA